MSDQQDKTFIGNVFTGKFHEATGQIDLTFLINRDSLATLVSLATEAKKAEAAGQLLPPGTSSHEKYGRQIKLRIRQSRSGNLYCELDTWQPDPNKAKKPEPAQPATVVTPVVQDVPPDQDDLPF